MGKAFFTEGARLAWRALGRAVRAGGLPGLVGLLGATLVAPAAWAEEGAAAWVVEEVVPLPCAPPPLPVCDSVPEGCPCPDWCIPDPLLRLPCIDACVDTFRKARDESCLKLGAGAYHWFHMDSESGDFTYGYPNGGEGTYFYYVTGDLECDGCALGLGIPKIGAHAQVRFRDDTNFRDWFSGPVWLYEGYVFADVGHLGRIKAGAVWKRFGLDWDGSFWGNVPYYDGHKLDTDWGVSWEQVWNPEGRLSVATFAQVFLTENRVNGSLRGADPESSKLFEERLTGVARVVPTWKFDTNTALAVGISGLLGQIHAESSAQRDDTMVAFAVDATFTWCGFEAFAEILGAWGRRHESHYVTGGPSDQAWNLLAGVAYRQGPLKARFAYSHGAYEDPGGDQDLFVAGLDVTLTNWLTFTVEYVRWDVQVDGASSVKFEDGWQFVLHWRF